MRAHSRGRANGREIRTMTTPRQMHLGVMLLAAGNHVAGWRLPEAQAGSENLDLIQHIAQTAERGKFDLIFLADAVNTSPKMHPSMVVRFEPLTLLAALAMTTTRVGLGATASTTYTEPYNLARAFASIDHLSGGRAAWNVVTGAFAEAAANFSRESHPPHEERYAAAAEFVSVMKGLWDSWEDGALVMDKASGTFIDASKMHTLNHQGKFFHVKGPLNHTRPPQGYPVFIQAGASDTGRDLAASIAEVVFTVQQDLEAAKAFASDLRTRAGKFGRNPAHLKILPGLCPIVAPPRLKPNASSLNLPNSLTRFPRSKCWPSAWGTISPGIRLMAPSPNFPHRPSCKVMR